MKVTRERSRLALLGALVAGLFLLSAGSIWQCAQALDDELLRRSMIPLIALLEDAQKSRDDLALQRVVHAVLKMPGVAWAGVMDAQGQFLAHSQSSKIGSMWTGAPSRWKPLVLELSHEDGQRFRRRVAGWGMAGTAGFLALLVGLVFYEQRRLSRVREELDEAQALTRELKESLADLRQRRDEQAAVLRECIQSAMAQASRPGLLLDGCQRVIGCHPQLAKRLGYSAAEQVLESSWRDIAALKDCGPALSDSLQNPRRTFRTSTLPGNLSLDIWTEATEGGGFFTWLVCNL